MEQKNETDNLSDDTEATDSSSVAPESISSKKDFSPSMAAAAATQNGLRVTFKSEKQVPSEPRSVFTSSSFLVKTDLFQLQRDFAKEMVASRRA